MVSRTGSRFGRRIIWLALAVVIVAGGYTAGWFYMARALESRIASSLAQLNGGGVRAFCEEPQARGFPFRIGLFCKSVFYENVRDGVSIRAGALRTAAHVYQPFRVLSEIDGPAGIMLPFTLPLEARWESLRASGRLARPLPERISVEGRAIDLFAEEGSGMPLATLGTIQMHARQHEQDLDLAVSFGNLALGEEVVTNVPPLEGRTRVRIADGIALLQERVRDLRGQSGIIEEMVVGLVGEQAGLSVSGPVSIAEDGRIDAELSVTISDPAAVARIMAEMFPDEREAITTAATVMGGLGNAPIQLRIVQGRVFVGFIPVGRIPPV